MKQVFSLFSYLISILTIFCFPIAIVSLIILFISGIIGGFLWTYVINTWLVYFGYIPCVVFWHGFLLGIIPYIGYYSVPIAIITFIVMLIL